MPPTDSDTGIVKLQAEFKACREKSDTRWANLDKEWAVVNGTLERIWLSIEELKALIYKGNGKMSMLEEVHTNSRFRKGANKFLWILLGVCLSSFAVGITALITQYLKN